MKLAFGPEAVEDDAVDCDRDDFDDNLDKSTDESPVLKTAQKRVVGFVFEEGSTSVLVARPTPHVLVVAILLAGVKNDCSGDPHSGGEEEESDAEGGVVDGRLLCLPVSTLPIRVEDEDADDQRKTSDGKEGDLGPDLLVWRPWWEAAAWRQGTSRVEDREDR